MLQKNNISPLLVDHSDENIQNILKFIVTKDIIIVNDGSLKLEESLNYNSDSEMSNDMMYISTDGSKKLNFMGANHKRNDNAIDKSLNNSKTIADIDDPVLFKTKKNPFNKYLDKVDLVEIAIREPLLSNNQEKQI